MNDLTKVKRNIEIVDKIIPSFTDEEADRLKNHTFRKDNMNLIEDIREKYNLTWSELRFAKRFIY